MSRTLLTEYRTGSFELDSVGGPWAGYTLNEGWNGWATPRFTLEVAQQIMENFRTRFGCSVTFDEASQKFLMHPCKHVDKDMTARYSKEYGGKEFPCEMNPYEEPEVFGFEDVTIAGETVRLYWIGTFGWTWEDAA